MGRPKGSGGKINKTYSKEEKEQYIKEALEYGTRPTARKYKIGCGMLCNWIKSYHENGDKVVVNKYKIRNPLVKYQKKKSLTEKEQLEYEIMKLRIENERLKKGYLLKGDGSIVIYKK